MKKNIPRNKIICCDVLEGLKNLPDQSVQCVVTSPPYFGLRNYKIEGQLGLEPTPQEYVRNLVNVFNEIWRVLRDDGTVWLNLGDSYNAGRNGGYAGGGKQGSKECYVQKSGMNIPGLKPKDLIGVPWRVAFALQDAGWYLRNEIIWAKSISFCKTYVGSCMPDSCRDRSTRSHEQIFLLTKKPKYFYDQEAIKEQGVWPAGTKAAKGSGTREGNRRGEGYATYSGKRNTRSVWAIPVKPYREAHFATFPEALVEPFIKAGTSEKGSCSECGAPYKRISKRSNPYPKVEDSELDRYGTGKAGVHRRVGGQYQKWLDANPMKTVGWEKTCKCENSEIVPCVVLDIFMGSGTSAVVAKKLGRDFLGFDLNPEYIEIANKRLDEILI